MAIVKMKKATLIALQSDKEAIVKKMQEFGCLHIIDLGEQIASGDAQELKSDDESEIVSELEARISHTKYCLDFIAKYDRSKKQLFAPKIEVSHEELLSHVKDEDRLKKIYGQCKSIDERFADIKNSDAKINNQIAHLMPWIGLELPVEELVNTKNTVIAAGSVPLKFAEDFKSSILNSGSEVYLESINQGRENSYFIVIYHNSLEEAISQIQKQYSWSKFSFNDLTGTVVENIKALKSRLSELASRKNDLIKEAENLVENRQYLQILFDALIIEKDKKEIVKSFGKTKHTFMVSAWLPAELTENLKQLLDHVTKEYHIFFEEPDDEEEYPVLLKNNPLVEPAEFITEQYSLPSPKGIDPDFIMAPFYITFYGMMVSDAAYGIILSLMTGYGLIKFKPTGTLKKVLTLLCLGGVSTFFWGAAFGGWFGDLIKIKPFLFNPLNEPIKMLGLCLGLGVVHLYVGLGLKAYMNIRDGHILDAIYDQGFWYLFLTGLMLLALPSTAVIGKYMALVGAAGLILTQGRSNKNIIKRLLSGLLSLYNVTAYLGDVMSYSRLFALGLATGVIGAVINAMSLMLGGNIIGIFFMVIFLVIGHVFNISINALGAYVHASRLQYVEFFGKFYEGDGKPFIPFKTKTKFIEQK